MKTLSVVIPIYNEEKNIPVLYGELTKIFKELSEMSIDYELIFVNDGSRDASLDELNKVAQQDNKVQIANFSRNFGHQAAITCGMERSTGEYIVTMDADMQDPPSLLIDLVKRAENGADIVYARRTARDDGWLKRIFAHAYYFILKRISSVDMPTQVGDFRLTNRKVQNELNKLKEKSRYYRGLVAWIGFKQEFVEFDRPNRFHGTTGYTWSKMFKLGFDGFTSFSSFPLRITAFVGTFMIITSILMFSYVAYDAIIRDVPYPLYKWLVIIVYGFMGVQSILLWIIGEYIGRMNDELKGRPIYVVDKDKSKLREDGEDSANFSRYA